MRPIAPFVAKQADGPLKVIGYQRTLVVDQSDNDAYGFRRYVEGFMAAFYHPVSIEFLRDQDGENGAVRPALSMAVQRIMAGDVDLLVAEDIGRISRNRHDAIEFIEKCIGAGTRVILIHDAIDTANDTWMYDVLALAGCRLPDTKFTGNRIRRGLRRRQRQRDSESK